MSIRRLARLIACVALVAGAGFGYRTSGGALKTADARISQLAVEVPEVPAARQALERHRTRFGPWLTGPSTISRIERAGDWLRPVPAGALGRAADRAASLFLPERADRLFRLGDEASGVSVEVTIAGLAPAPAEVADGYVVYRRAHSSGGDLLQRPTADGTEDYLIFEAPPERAHVSYSVALGTGIAGLRLLANMLEFLDESGNPRLRMSSPYILDRDGAVHAASVAVPDCAFDASPLPPWGRPVTVPGASRCTVEVRWEAKDVGYPAILDPSWTATHNTMSVARLNHTATLLNPDPQRHIARVLLVGGRTASGARTRTVDVYDPSFDQFAPTGSMTCPREMHTATLLADGRVLVVGGLTSGDGLPGGAPDAVCPSAEIYNPSTGMWTSVTLGTQIPTWGHAASRIEGGAHSGKVLITGGRTAPNGKPTSAAYLFNPLTGTTQKIPSLPASRYLHGQAAQTGGGKVVIGGGKCPDCTALNTSFDADTNVADPTKIKWSGSGSAAASGEGPVLVRLFGDRVLIVGGGNAGSATATSQIHEFGSTGWHDNSSMSTPRVQHRAAVTSDGHVIVAGGRDAAGNVLASAEIWNPQTNTWSVNPTVIVPMNTGRASHTLTGMQAGKVLAAGGTDNSGPPTDTAEVYPITVGGSLCDPACDPVTSECVGDQCIPKPCSPGTADCDGDLTSGCETNLGTPANCGACGNVCSANGTCASSGDSYTCECNPGYAGNGNTCADINECAINNGGCSPNATCTNTPGSFICACNAGFSGDGVTCADIDECATGTHSCDANATCTNVPGSRTCTCNSGFSGDGLTCVDIDECATGTHNCNPNATCFNSPGSFTCTCNSGFSGDGLTCADIDECATGTHNCDPNATCTNVPGSRTCTCNAGWAGDGLTCVDIDECVADTDNCDFNATCTNSPGAFTCACNPGYAGDGVACADIDECALGTDDCHRATMTCTNIPGSFSCVCNAGLGNCNGDVADGCEADLTTTSNCGGCGNTCAIPANATATCSDQTCGFSCNTGFDNCDGNDGCETDITTTQNCGACGNACTLANASATCASGNCAIASCNAGFGDCNAASADGCENDLTTTQNCGACGVSCDDTNSCTFDSCVGNACRNVDRNRCANPDPGPDNTDPPPCGPNGCAVCNFANSYPGCANPDSDGDGLGDVWEEAGVGAGVDGGMIDFDCNGIYDSNDVVIPGANKNVADIYIKASAMVPTAAEASDPVRDHRPTQEAVMRLLAAFAGSHLTTSPVRCAAGSPACPAGLSCSIEDYVCLPTCSTDTDCETGRCVDGQCRLRRLHMNYSEINAIPHKNVIFFGPVQSGCMTFGDVSQGVNFYDIKASPLNFDPKTALFTHYGVFGHYQTCDSAATCANVNCRPPEETAEKDFRNTGLAEVAGNDWAVTLGAHAIASLDANGNPIEPAERILQKELQDSGATMHELGHNLGLRHGGPDCNVLPAGEVCDYAPDQKFKNNYVSIMNLTYQFGIPTTTTPGSKVADGPVAMDFSRGVLGTLGTLDEGALVESAGVSPGLPSPFNTYLVKYWCSVEDPLNPGVLVRIETYGSTNPGTAIDWNCDQIIQTLPLPYPGEDINNNGVFETMRGAEDWSHLFYPYQCSFFFAD